MNAWTCHVTCTHTHTHYTPTDMLNILMAHTHMHTLSYTPQISDTYIKVSQTSAKVTLSSGAKTARLMPSQGRSQGPSKGAADAQSTFSVSHDTRLVASSDSGCSWVDRIKDCDASVAQSWTTSHSGQLSMGQNIAAKLQGQGGGQDHTAGVGAGHADTASTTESSSHAGSVIHFCLACSLVCDSNINH